VQCSASAGGGANRMTTLGQLSYELAKDVKLWHQLHHQHLEGFFLNLSFGKGSLQPRPVYAMEGDKWPPPCSCGRHGSCDLHPSQPSRFLHHLQAVATLVWSLDDCS
jgi:hypothetical protein